MKAEIDLKTNGIYIVKNGQVQLIQPPQGGFGEQSFTYKDGKSNSHGREKNSVNLI